MCSLRNPGQPCQCCRQLPPRSILEVMRWLRCYALCSVFTGTKQSACCGLQTRCPAGSSIAWWNDAPQGSCANSTTTDSPAADAGTGHWRQPRDLGALSVGAVTCAAPFRPSVIRYRKRCWSRRRAPFLFLNLPFVTQPCRHLQQRCTGVPCSCCIAGVLRVCSVVATSVVYLAPRCARSCTLTRSAVAQHSSF